MKRRLLGVVMAAAVIGLLAGCEDNVTVNIKLNDTSDISDFEGSETVSGDEAEEMTEDAVSEDAVTVTEEGAEAQDEETAEEAADAQEEEPEDEEAAVAGDEAETGIGDEAEESAEEESESDMTDISIGTTGFKITVPSGYVEGDVTELDREDDMIAYYKSDKYDMDFDIYQFPKDTKGLEDYTADESKSYGADSFDTLDINGITVTRYYSEDEFEGVKYVTANYIFEAGDDFGELVFWLDGDDAEELAEQIINTLGK